MCDLFIPWINFIISIFAAGSTAYFFSTVLKSPNNQSITKRSFADRLPSEWVWVIITISSLIFLFSISEAFVQLAQTPNGESSVGRAEALIGISVGVIGLVITGMTGMALAAAWRAVDKSSQALKDLKHLEARIQRNGLRALCYAEAINLRSHNELLGDLLTRAFAAEEENESIAILVAINNDPSHNSLFKESSLSSGIINYIRMLASSKQATALQNLQLLSLIE